MQTENLPLFDQWKAAAADLHAAYGKRSADSETATEEYARALAAYREVCDLCSSTWYGALGDGDAAGSDRTSL